MDNIEINSDLIDTKKIIEKIKEEANKKRGYEIDFDNAQYEMSVSIREGNLEKTVDLSIDDLKWMRQENVVTSYYEFKTNRKFAKQIIVLKKIFRKILKSIVEEPLKKQTLFNQHTVRFSDSVNNAILNLNDKVESCVENKKEVDKLKAKIELLEKKINSLNAVQNKELE